MACAALAMGVASALGATASTDYNAVGVDAPDPQVESRFAERLSAAGDLTGDGVPDVFASSYTVDVDGVEEAGKAYLINGATREIVYGLTATDPPEKGDHFGFYISVVGDVNGDGRDDVAVGAESKDVDGNENQGRLYVFDGPTGEPVRHIDNPHPQANATFGSRIGSAGDVNGDGLADIIAGAPRNDVPAGCGNEAPVPPDCRKDLGQAFVFSGADGSVLREYNVPPGDRPVPHQTCDTTSSCGNLGYSVQVLGDLDKDGVPDHMVAAGSLRPIPAQHGRIYVFSGANGAVLTRIDQPDPDPIAVFGLQDTDRYTPGDLNADGVPEIAGHGFLQDGSNGEQSAGRLWIFDGKRSVETGRGVVLYEIRDPNPTANKAFGWAQSKTDYNQDGIPDLYVSNLSGHNPGDTAREATYLFDGRDGSLLKRLELPASVSQDNQPGNTGSALGWSSRAPGDLNGDGEPDYVAAAPFQDVDGTQDQGKVFYFLSNVPAQQPPGQQPSPGAGPCGDPAAAGYVHPAKIRVSRARVLRRDRRLDVLAPITSRAEGDVAVRFHADNRIDTFDEDVSEAKTELDEIRIFKKIRRGQADLGTGIVNINYLGDEDTRPQFVRLRAASQRAKLDVDQISLVGDRLSARGSVTSRARGIVRFRYSYLDEQGGPHVHEARAKIKDDGDWKLDNDQVPLQLARCGGYLSIQFTGYFPRRIRGEQLAYQLNPGQTRTP